MLDSNLATVNKHCCSFSCYTLIGLHCNIYLFHYIFCFLLFIFLFVSSPPVSFSLSLALPLSRSLCIWKMPPGTWRCQPKGYRAPALVIVCNYPANLFTSAGAAWWSWGSNCQNGGKKRKGGRGMSDSSGWEWSFIIEAWEGGGWTEELIAFIKCTALSEATFSFALISVERTEIIKWTLRCISSDSGKHWCVLTPLLNVLYEKGKPGCFCVMLCGQNSRAHNRTFEWMNVCEVLVAGAMAEWSLHLLRLHTQKAAGSEMSVCLVAKSRPRLSVCLFIPLTIRQRSRPWELRQTLYFLILVKNKNVFI